LGGKAIVTATDDETIRLWDLATGQELHRFERPSNQAAERDVDKGFGVAIAPDGSRVAAGDGKTVLVWDLNSGKQLHESKGLKSQVSGLRFAPDNKSLWARDSMWSDAIWDLATGRRVARAGGKQGKVPGLGGDETPALAPDLKWTYTWITNDCLG